MQTEIFTKNAQKCNENMHQICQYMQNMQKKYAVICTYMLAINMHIYAKYMQLYALYVDICDGNYMQKYAKKNMHKYAKICNYMQ